MCNLYSQKKSQAEVRDLAKAMVDRAGNMPSLPAIFPKATPDVGTHLVFSFLTTDASPDVAPIHPDATPVLLLDEAAREQWMTAPWEIARDLQKPPLAGTLRVVVVDMKEDAG
jgi:putative SOS response-associated peptidase YedK